jgi:undecaprenyl-diphosphatase
LIDYLKQFDRELFLFLNNLHHPYLDTVMNLFSDRFFWIPFYLLLLLLLGLKNGWRSLLITLPLVALIITTSDQLSVHLFKDVFRRYRPCHNEEIRNMIHLIKGCGGIYGFISSHASNSFALAVFIGLNFKNRIKFALFFMLSWSMLVSYSRIYNGVHYPADIAAGALFGSVIGWAGYKINSWLFSRYQIFQFNRES